MWTGSAKRVDNSLTLSTTEDTGDVEEEPFYAFTIVDAATLVGVT